MTRPVWVVATAVAAALLTGCDLADRLEGKSPGREWHEQRVLTLVDTTPTQLPDIVVTAPDVPPVIVEPVTPVVDVLPVVVEPVEPVAPIVDVPAIEPAQPEPVVAPVACQPQFMVRRCGPDGAMPW